MVYDVDAQCGDGVADHICDLPDDYHAPRGSPEHGSYRLGSIEVGSRPYRGHEPEVDGKDLATYIEDTVVSAIDSGKYDIIVAPEYSYCNLHNPMTEKGLEDLVSTYVEHAKDRKVLVMPGSAMVKYDDHRIENVLPIIASEGNGEVTVHYYSKKRGWTDDDRFVSIQRDDDPDARWQAGTNPGVFEWDGRSIGVEICRDHYEKVIKKERVPRVDIQFIPSCGMDLKWSPAPHIKKRGYAIDCDGYYGETDVIQRSNRLFSFGRYAFVDGVGKEDRIREYALDFEGRTARKTLDQAILEPLAPSCLGGITVL